MNPGAAADEDARRMSQALALAERGLYTTDPNPRVGCMLVRDGQVVGEGWHVRAGEPHAEALALRAAGALARGATAYVTLEPCSHTGRTPPCADALIRAGVARVVAACKDPNPKVSGAGIERLKAARIGVATGVLEEPCRALNAGFFRRFESMRPFVRLKIAMSLDARTALKDGRSKWITGEAARADVQHWRARSSAICVGSGTVRADDPRLDVRLSYGPWVRQPLRVLLDSRLAIAAGANVLRDDNVLVFSALDARARDPLPYTVERVARAGQGLDLAAVLRNLAGREINELLVESGPSLAASFIRERLVDELIVYTAPMLLGSDARPMLQMSGVAAIEEAPRFEFADVRQIGDDLRLTLKPK
jgi:diaminohydroxyphosphoribosylaminopyrimidine deaminase/5-amino-6-(5-phosphoribosylamino)uracil reductase